ncbi:MAG TPA: ABC transporter ATP-binding protein [Clostridiaceae bacterium]|nr:ABC transporter ATP-binding protein [Clostridiaceae bacterium]
MKQNWDEPLFEVKSTRELLLLRPTRFAIYIFACLFPIVMQVSMAYVLSNVLGLLQHSGAADWRRTIIWAAVFALGAPLLQLTSRYLRIGYMRDTLLDLRRLVFQRILSLSYQTFSRRSRDSYVSKLTNDINLFEKDFFLSLLNVIFAVGAATVSLILILLEDLVFGIIIAILAAALMLIARLFRQPLVNTREAIMQENELFSLKIGNFFSGLEIIRLNRVEEHFKEDTDAQSLQLEEAKYRGRFLQQLQELVLSKTSTLMTLVTVAYVGIMMAQGKMSLAIAALLLQLQGNIAWPLISLFDMRNRLIASNKIFQTLIESPGDETVLAEREAASANVEAAGAKILLNKQQAVIVEAERRSTLNLLSQDIILTDLTYKFADAQEPVLRQADLHLQGGGKYLLKGVSGSGKTTLLNLLSGAFRDYEGEITYGGISFRDIDEESFNEGTALILQDVYLFETTIRENICLFKKYSDIEVERAVQIAGLSGLTKQLQQGLDTELTENGHNLSGGERQRISIARAIIKGSRLLLADEITSAIDPNLGREIEQGILNLPMTVVAISHRYYDGVSDRYDGVIELKQGKLALYPSDYYFSGKRHWPEAGREVTNV